MVPRISFGFIICTYLPGIFLTLIFYNLVFTKLFIIEDTLFWKTVISFYVAASPLIFGLFIDGLRHYLEQLCGSSPGRNRDMGDSDSWAINKCVMWRHWDHFKRDDLITSKDDYGKSFLEHMIDIYTVQFHMYEFFYNLAFAIMIVVPYLLISLFIVDDEHLKYIILLGISVTIVPLAFKLGWVMNIQNKSLIEAYFKERNG
jgi:hypothetical protein